MPNQIQNNVIRHARDDMAANPSASHDPVSPQPERKSTAPSTSSVLWAAWRAGLKDLQTAVLHAFPQGHVAQHEEPGAIAVPTQQIVTEEMTHDAEISYADMMEHSRGTSPRPDRDRGRSR